MAWRIEMLQGGSTDPEIAGEVRKIARGYDRVMVCLDSNHTHDHVLAELHTYAPLVSIDSYCIVFDTVIEELPATVLKCPPWTRGNSPMTAVASYLSDIADQRVQGRDGKRLAFHIDTTIDSKLLISVAPRGYLRPISGNRSIAVSTDEDLAHHPDESIVVFGHGPHSRVRLARPC